MERKKTALQKVAKAFSIFSLLCAIGCGIYLFIEFEHANEVFKASMSATIFFFAMVHLVLSAMANTNLPDLSIDKNAD